MGGSCEATRWAAVIVGIFCKRGGDHLSFGILPQGSRFPPPPHLPREPQGPRSPLPPHLKVPRSHLALQGPPTPTLRWPLFFVTENIQPCSAVGTSTPWASGQQVHEPMGSCVQPVRKKRNQTCRLLTSGSLPTLPMCQSSWGHKCGQCVCPMARGYSQDA